MAWNKAALLPKHSTDAMQRGSASVQKKMNSLKALYDINQFKYMVIKFLTSFLQFYVEGVFINSNRYI